MISPRVSRIAGFVVLGAVLAVSWRAAIAQGRVLGGPDETVATAAVEAEQALARTRMKVRVSAVGFDIAANSAASRDLQGIASAGGGLYVPATDAERLAGALQQAVEGTGGSPAKTRGRVALVPIAPAPGAPSNAPRIAAAVREALRGADLGIVSEDEVRAQLASQSVDLKSAVTFAQLQDLGRGVKADYVVYVRILSVGRPLNSEVVGERNIAVLANSIESRTGKVAHTYQLGIRFVDPDNEVASLVPEAVALEGAKKLLAGFLAKLPPAR